MEAHIKIARVFGVQIGLHYSWLLIALLVVLSLGSLFQSTNPGWSAATAWLTAVITGLLFFTSVVVHELSHAAVAKMRGLPVRAITLFALGGVAQIEREAADAKTEFWMGIIGPITSAVIGGICLAIAAAIGWEPTPDAMLSPSTPLLAMLVWLGYINIVLAIFNMIPGFPLDGGRVLRAIVWWSTGDANRSTRIAARIGQAVALLFIVWGIFSFFGGAGLGGLWIAFIGWFLLSAAGASYAQVEITQNLRGVRVGDVMARDCPVISGNTNLQTFTDEYLLRTGRRCFVVEEDGNIAGLITPNEVAQVEPRKRAFTTVDDAMRPLETLRTIEPESPVTDALELMGREDVNQLPVVRSGRLEGILTRSHIVQLLKSRAELNM